MPLLNELLHETIDRLTATRRLPEACYRVQLHAGFTFRDAAAIVPYLRELGITHLYLSPCLKARPGSMHGYDVVDYGQLNPELGGEAGFQELVEALRANDMQQIVDTVPNHMGIGTNENAWWNDVLENGTASAYADYFDIAWHGSPRVSLHNKVLLPVLGEQYGTVLEKGELKLTFDEAGFAVTYYQRRFPINLPGYARLLSYCDARIEQTVQATSEDYTQYQAIITAIAQLPEKPASRELALHRHREKENIKQRLTVLAQRSEAVRACIRGRLDAFNGKPGEAASFDLLDELLASQSYRLAYWRTAPDEINYRRFFDINDLAATQMEREEVFRDAHALTLRLVAEGAIAGLRIDHPDGLYDPEVYFMRLQREYLLACAKQTMAQNARYAGLDWQQTKDELLRRLPAILDTRKDEPLKWPLYAVAEKILAVGEPLPPSWAVFGTSGYDALNQINGLFVDSRGQQTLTQMYHHWIGNEASYAEVCYRNKHLILHTSLASEVHMLAHLLDRLAQSDRHWQDFSLDGLRKALTETIACFPVYRCYVCDTGPLPADVAHMQSAAEHAIARNPRIDPSLFHFICDVVLLRSKYAVAREQMDLQRRFAGKFQQVTAPATAKGIEDTAFYNYNRLVSLNEVGGDAARFGVPPQEMHMYLQERQKLYPYALSTLSTHDTKRSEDVRARINVISEMVDEWMRCVMRWAALNADCRRRVGGIDAPSRNDEYLLYQTLVGAWPEPAGVDSPAAVHDYRFVERIQAYMLKAIREAKVHTSWTEANQPYEAAVHDFVAKILGRESKFLRDFRSFHARIADCAMMNCLAQTLLKLTMPGVPDAYQGTELVDLSLVDPDNRRSVDYALRRQLLEEMRQRAGSDLAGLVHDLTSCLDSRTKLYMTWRALEARRRYPGLFSLGEYVPLKAEGVLADNVFAFARRHKGVCALVAVPRLVTKLHEQPDGRYAGPAVWDDTALRWPEFACAKLVNMLDGRAIVPEGQLRMRDLCATMPVALWVSGA